MDKQVQQPPRPETRSDSFSRAETLLREYRLFNNYLSETVKLQNNKVHESKEMVPESREVYKENYANLSLNSNRVDESEDTGLLTVVDQLDPLKNSDDPLVSLVHSLVDVSPLNGSSTTNQIIHINSVSSDTSTINTMISTTNSTPNQSPNAWQSSVQVCRIAFALFH